MNESWSRHEKGQRRCNHFGAVYDVILSRYADRQSKSHRCEVRGNLMEWQSIFVPGNFQLIKSPGSLRIKTARPDQTGPR